MPTMANKYYDNWGSYEAMVNDWNQGPYNYDKREYDSIPLPENFPTDEQVIFAAYGTEQSYEGDAFTLFEKDGKLWLNSGCHCSCSGLEGMWNPSETTWKALKDMGIADPNEGWSCFTLETRQAFKDLVLSRLQ